MGRARARAGEEPTARREHERCREGDGGSQMGRAGERGACSREGPTEKGSRINAEGQRERERLRQRERERLRQRGTSEVNRWVRSMNEGRKKKGFERQKE